jgi:hypothetical protein
MVIVVCFAYNDDEADGRVAPSGGAIHFDGIFVVSLAA